MKIELDFTTQGDEDLDGYNVHHYFRDDALVRARLADEADEANAILADAYLGADVHGVDVEWRVIG